MLVALSAAADAASRARLQEIERYATDAVIEDLQKTPPDLVIVDRAKDIYPVYLQVDFLAYFARDPRFARIWRDYAKVATTEHFDLWQRDNAAAAMAP